MAKWPQRLPHTHTHTGRHTQYTRTFKHIHILLPPRHNQTNINVEHQMCFDTLIQRWTGKRRERRRSCQTSSLCSVITSTPAECTRRGKYCWAFVLSVQQRALKRYAPLWPPSLLLFFISEGFLSSSSQLLLVVLNYLFIYLKTFPLTLLWIG